MPRRSVYFNDDEYEQITEKDNPNGYIRRLIREDGGGESDAE